MGLPVITEVSEWLGLESKQRREEVGRCLLVDWGVAGSLWQVQHWEVVLGS